MNNFPNLISKRVNVSKKGKLAETIFSQSLSFTFTALFPRPITPRPPPPKKNHNLYLEKDCTIAHIHINIGRVPTFPLPEVVYINYMKFNC